jgi:hypothetical protein
MAGPALEPWERRLLRLVSEQGAMPFDQMARFLDVEERQAARVGWHLAERDLVTCRRVLHGEPAWLWLSFRGHRLSGTGLELLRPTPRGLALIRAVNEVRLYIEGRAPQARWICGRAVRHEQGNRGPRPQAVVEVDGERHALVVRPGRAAAHLPQERVRIEPLLARYDAVVIFASSPVRAALRRLERRHGYRNLVLRPIPESPPAAGPDG